MILQAHTEYISNDAKQKLKITKQKIFSITVGKLL